MVTFVVFLLRLHVNVPFPVASELDLAEALLYLRLAGVHLETLKVVLIVPVSLPQLGAVVAGTAAEADMLPNAGTISATASMAT